MTGVTRREHAKGPAATGPLAQHLVSYGRPQSTTAPAGRETVPTVIDTARVGACLPVRVDPDTLYRRGWRVREERGHDPNGEPVEARSAFLDAGTVRMEWRATTGDYWHSPGWLAAEASLPKLLDAGDPPSNEAVLSWADCLDALTRMRAMAEAAAGVDLPDLPDLRVQRLDVLGAWAVDPVPYLAMASRVTLPRLRTRSYPGSVAWTTRTGRPRVRLYDKAAEAGHPVGRPLRLEVQVVKPAARVTRGASGERVGARVADWTAAVAADVLAGAVAAVGLDRSIPPRLVARQTLIDTLGRVRGLAAWTFLRDAEDLGGEAEAEPDKCRRYRLRKACREAGIPALTDDVLASLPTVGGVTLSPYTLSNTSRVVADSATAGSGGDPR